MGTWNQNVKEMALKKSFYNDNNGQFSVTCALTYLGTVWYATILRFLARAFTALCIRPRMIEPKNITLYLFKHMYLLFALSSPLGAGAGQDMALLATVTTWIPAPIPTIHSILCRCGR